MFATTVDIAKHILHGAIVERNTAYAELKTVKAVRDKATANAKSRTVALNDARADFERVSTALDEAIAASKAVIQQRNAAVLGVARLSAATQNKGKGTVTSGRVTRN